MMVFIDSWLPWLGDLLSLGGNILALILIMAFVLWTLLCERLYFLYFVYPDHVRSAIRLWNERKDKQSWFAHQYRDHLRHRISNNPRSMAAGVSKATVSTLAGMVVAIFGLLIGKFAERRAISERDRLEARLSYITDTRNA
jgi:biopolymer transport protein ExbB